MGVQRAVGVLPRPRGSLHWLRVAGGDALGKGGAEAGEDRTAHGTQRFTPLWASSHPRAPQLPDHPACQAPEGQSEDPDHAARGHWAQRGRALAAAAQRPAGSLSPHQLHLPPLSPGEGRQRLLHSAAGLHHRPAEDSVGGRLGGGGPGRAAGSTPWWHSASPWAGCPAGLGERPPWLPALGPRPPLPSPGPAHRSVKGLPRPIGEPMGLAGAAHPNFPPR